MKPHMKVIQRNGVDIFVTSSAKMKKTRKEVNSDFHLIEHCRLEREIMEDSQ